MSNRVPKSDQLRVSLTIIALALIIGLPSPLRAQTFQTVPALAFTKAFAGAEPLPQVLTIAYTDQSTVRFSAIASTNSGGNWLSISPGGSGCKWLKVLPTQGVNAGAYTVSVTTKNLPGQGLIPGTYIGQQLLAATTGNVTIPVSVTVGDPVFVQLPAVTFNTTRGVNPSPQVIAIDSTSAAIRFTPIAASGKGGNWLSISPSGSGCCFTPTNITVSANASALAAGTYVGEINVIEFANPGKSMTIPVVLNVASADEETSRTTTNGDAP